MAHLVDDPSVYAYLGITQAVEDPSGQALLIRDAVEEMLASTTGQTFGDEESLSGVQHDGTGTDVIYTARPIKTLTSIAIVNPYDNDDQEDIDVLQDVTFKVGSRRIGLRCTTFPKGRNNVLISYVAAANAPALAKQAVREAVATIFRRIGSEDARSEQIGTFQHVMLRKLEESMSWQKAVDLLTVPNIG